MSEAKFPVLDAGAAPANRPSVSKFRPKSFYARSAVFLSMVIVGMLGGSSAYYLSLVHMDISEMISRDAAAVAGLAARSLEGPLREKDSGEVDNVLRSALKTGSIGEIRLVSDAGDFLRRAYRESGRVVIDTNFDGPGRRTDLARPVEGYVDGSRLGSIRVVISEDTQRTLLLRMARDGLIGLTILLGLGLFLLHLQLRPTAKALIELARFSRDLDSGTKLPPPIHESGVLEFDALGQTLARSAQRIKLQAEELRSSSERLRLAVDTMEDGFAIYDAQGCLILSNQRYADYSPDAARHLCVPGANFKHWLDGVVSGSVSVEYMGGDLQSWLEWRVPSTRANTRSCEIHLRDDRWIRGIDRATAEGSFVAIRTDITDLKRARLDAEAASQAKSEFLANMSHEIRTPLTGIIGMADVLLEGEIQDEQREYVSLSRKSAVHLLEIINDILDFSKIESAGMQIEDVPFTLDEALADALQVQRIRAHSKGLDFQVVNEVTTDRKLVGDPGKIRQILVNLLGNAVKFTESGSVKLKIESAEHDDRHLQIRFIVTDTGEGIPLAVQPHLLKPFMQADASTQRRFGGSGLGLAISARLAEMMGGALWFESAQGKGSMFVLDIKFLLGDRVTPPSPLTGGSNPSVRSNFSLVVIDDNDINRLTVLRLMGKRGHRVFESEGAADGLALVKEVTPDVILLDLQLPEMDGFEALKRLRAMQGPVARTPVIALTAHALVGDSERCISAGFDGYVSKPFHIDTLLGEINRVLLRHDSARQLERSVPRSMPPARFGRIFAGLDGDYVLFSEIAAKAAQQFDVFADQLEKLCAVNDLAGLATYAHRIKGNWAPYALGADEFLPQLLMDATQSGDVKTAADYATRLAGALREAAKVLRCWLEQAGVGSAPSAALAKNRIFEPAVKQGY